MSEPDTQVNDPTLKLDSVDPDSNKAKVFSREEANAMRQEMGLPTQPDPMEPKPIPKSEQAIAGEEGKELKRQLDALKAQQNKT